MKSCFQSEVLFLKWSFQDYVFHSLCFRCLTTSVDHFFQINWFSVICSQSPRPTLSTLKLFLTTSLKCFTGLSLRHPPKHKIAIFNIRHYCCSTNQYIYYWDFSLYTIRCICLGTLLEWRMLIYPKQLLYRELQYRNRYHHHHHRYTNCTDSHGSLSPSVPICSHSRQILDMAFSVCTELMNVRFCWLTNTGVSMCRSPWVNII